MFVAPGSEAAKGQAWRWRKAGGKVGDDEDEVDEEDETSMGTIAVKTVFAVNAEGYSYEVHVSR